MMEPPLDEIVCVEVIVNGKPLFMPVREWAMDPPAGAYRVIDRKHPQPVPVRDNRIHVIVGVRGVR